MPADPYARNPALDELRDRYGASMVDGWQRKAAAPTLFPGGDLPGYTASGNPSAALLELPWQLRHAAARADQAGWARLHAEYGRGVPDADLAAMFDPAADDPANGDYIARVTAWAHGRPV